MKFQKSKLLLVVCLVFVLMSSMLVGCGSSDSSTSSPDSSVATPTGPVTPAAGTKAFESTEYGITFNYPESWGELEKGEGMVAGYAAKVTDQKDFFTFNILPTEEKIDWDTYGKSMEDQLKSQDSIKDIKILSNKNVNISGYKGIKLEYTGEVSGMKVKSYSLIIGKDKKSFGFTVVGAETAFDKYSSDMDNLLKTIYIK